MEQQKAKKPETTVVSKPLSGSDLQLYENFVERDKRAAELPVFKEHEPTTPGLSGMDDVAVSWEKICSILKTDHRQLASTTITTAAATCMRIAFVEGQTLVGRERNANLAVKFHRTFTTQIEALQRLRGKGGQRVTVKHNHIHEGGQAIVGNVSPGKGGGKIGD